MINNAFETQPSNLYRSLMTIILLIVVLIPSVGFGNKVYSGVNNITILNDQAYISYITYLNNSSYRTTGKISIQYAFDDVTIPRCSQFLISFDHAVYHNCYYFDNYGVPRNVYNATEHDSFGALVRTSYTPIIRGAFIDIGSKSGWSSFSITGPYRTGITEVSHYRAVFGTCHNPRPITCPAPVTPDDIYSNLIFFTTAPDTVTVYNASGLPVGKNKMYGLRASGSNNNWFKLYQPVSESHRSSNLDISSYKVTFKDGSVKNRLNSYYNCTLTIIDQSAGSSFDVREPTYWNLSNLSYSDEPDISTNNRRGVSHLHMLCVPKTPAIIKSVKADLYVDYFNLAHF